MKEETEMKSKQEGELRRILERVCADWTTWIKELKE